MTKTLSLQNKFITTVNSALLCLVEIDIVIDNGTVKVSYKFVRGVSPVRPPVSNV